MVRLRGRDRELAEQVKRLKAEYRRAKAAGDAVALARLRDEVWTLQAELVPVVPERGEPGLASLLSDLARMSLPQEMEAGNWVRALAACTALDLAVTTTLSALDGKGFLGKRLALLKLFYVEAPAVAEAAAYAGHLAGHPVGALRPLENLTSITFDLRTKVTVMRHVDRSLAGDPGAEADIQQAAVLQQETRTAALHGSTAATMRRKHEEAILAVLSLPARPDPVEDYFLASPESHPVRAARLTGRTVVYVVPGSKDRKGVAIRVNRDRAERSLVESTLLPDLKDDTVRSLTKAIQLAFQRYASDSLPPAQLDKILAEFLDWTGTAVWAGVLSAWPDLASQRLAVIPIGRAALLPLFTASVGGEPACTRIDLTIAPSARALHYAAIQPATDTLSRPLVAADHWGGDDALPYVDDEARAIAALYGTTPTLCETDTKKALGGHRSLRTLTGLPLPALTPVSAGIAAQLREATVAHLCCHGVLNDGNIAPALLLGGVMQLTQILKLDGYDNADEQGQLRGHPLVVLSACELGGFLDMGMPGEQAGFPGGFMALGARAVAGSLWQVPDGSPTSRLMEGFHRRLVDLPSNAALSATVAQAHRNGVLRMVWGSLAHYGV